MRHFVLSYQNVPANAIGEHREEMLVSYVQAKASLCVCLTDASTRIKRSRDDVISQILETHLWPTYSVLKHLVCKASICKAHMQQHKMIK